MINIQSFRHLYPFTSNWLDLDGLRYHYLDEGPKDAPPVLMLHGNPTWSFYYRTLIPEISRTHRVIVPDHIGCGFSDKPQQYSYTLDQHVKNVEHLAEHLGLQDISLVVHDWGGPIGLGYAVRHPETINRFVIFNTAASAAQITAIPKRIRFCRIPLIGKATVRGINGFSRGALYFATSQRSRFKSGVQAGYLAPYDSWQNRIAVHEFVKDIPLEENHPTRKTAVEIEAGLEQFQKHPMLILWGADDFCFTVKEFLADFQERFPRADIHILDQAGHYVVEDAYERILPQMTRFLQSP